MINLIHGDCIVEMANIPSKSIDMILCDLPYGTTVCQWDTLIPFDVLWANYTRIIKDQGAIVLTAAQPFAAVLACSNLKWFKYEWIWDKHIPRGFQIAKYRPMQRHENILVFGLGKVKYNPIMIERDKPVKVKNYSKKMTSNGVTYNSGKEYTYTHKSPDSIIEGCWEANAGKIHPTQKPVSLFEYLIKTYSDENDTVLDNCMGSGTTGVACLSTNRNFIGIEKELEYFNMAKARIDSFKKTDTQGTLL